MRLKLLTEDKRPMPTRKLGKIGYDVSLFSLGGQGSLETHGDKENCIKIVRRAYELGVNYFDTSPIYGPSEDIYGEAMTDFRKKIFLASKTEERDKGGSQKSLEKSLKRLKTDYLDLWQIHHVDTMEEVDQITAPGGALEAAIEAKEQGVVKHIGLTGHEDPNVLLELMRRHPFETVLCATNAADRHVKPSFLDTVVKEAKRKNMGIIGMKVFAQGHIFSEKGIKTKWEPISFVLSHPVSTIIVGCDNVAQLEENIAIVKSFRKLSDAELKDIEAQTKSNVRGAQFFRKKYGGYDSIEELDPPMFV